MSNPASRMHCLCASDEFPAVFLTILNDALAAMVGLFGKKKDPKEQVRELQRKMRQEMRTLDRQVYSIQREEQKPSHRHSSTTIRRENGCSPRPFTVLSTAPAFVVALPPVEDPESSAEPATVDIESMEEFVCKWATCGKEFTTKQPFYDHVKTIHVNPIIEYICEWEDCKRKKKPFEANYKSKKGCGSKYRESNIRPGSGGREGETSAKNGNEKPISGLRLNVEGYLTAAAELGEIAESEAIELGLPEGRREGNQIYRSANFGPLYEQTGRMRVAGYEEDQDIAEVVSVKSISEQVRAKHQNAHSDEKRYLRGYQGCPMAYTDGQRWTNGPDSAGPSSELE
ncbi:unnamed protein product, partial [Mesorhabditis belari]|uniref:C2H2-type domain-containing protein n=1 Tax=Mesorhabditis belari TaxID=2138241 RepID=A0AAF3F9W7_9BILA